MELTTSYSMKVPIPGQEYSSQSFHLSLSSVLSDASAPDEIQRQIHQSFQTVKAAVEREAKDNGNGGAEDVGHDHGQTQRNGKKKATAKQLAYINTLLTGAGITLSEANEQLKADYGCELYDLDLKSAGDLIEKLIALQKNKRAA